MKKLLFAVCCSLALPVWLFAQDSVKDPVDDNLQERVVFYQEFSTMRESFDTTEAGLKALIEKMDMVIRLDDHILDEHLYKELDRSAELQKTLKEAKASLDKMRVDQVNNDLHNLIMLGSAGLFFLLFIIFLIMFVLKNGKSKKLKKQLAENSELITEAEGKVTATDAAGKEREAKLKKELDELKAAIESERKSFRNKEADYTTQVTLIEEKIKKSALKEADLNYQIFQLELKLKNELESTIQEKCRLENRVVEMERELNEVRAHLNDESQKPRADEQLVSDLKGKVAWLEGENGPLRQWAENEKAAKEQAEKALFDKQQETDGLYRERDELWGRINQFEGRINDMQKNINYLDGVVGTLQHEKGQLEEQLQNGAGGQNVQGLNDRIADLERQLRESHEEKERLNTQISELLQFMDRFRH
jgi:predicted  nucleic acid-binding Zn-ribbon protein